MADSPFAIFDTLGTTEHALTAGDYKTPRVFTWTQEPVDVALDGSPIYGLYVAVTWDFAGHPTGIPIAQYDLFSSQRAANGDIIFRTMRTTDRTMVKCRGKIDKLTPATVNKARARAYGVVVSFTRVVVL